MDSKFLLFAALGCGVVMLLSFLRLRWTKWPLHPVAFLIWSTYAGATIGFSFLVGWVVKTLVVRFGGAKTYQSLKPVVFGLVAGELLGILIPIVFGWIFYLCTGESPKAMRLFP